MRVVSGIAGAEAGNSLGGPQGKTLFPFLRVGKVYKVKHLFLDDSLS